jgi:putative acetyltransferase
VRIAVEHLRITAGDLSDPRLAEFLDEHLREMRSVKPRGSKHALDLDRLRQPDITFWSVTDGDMLVGCGAIKWLDARHAELKSMRTAPARQRNGIGSLLLRHIITETRRMGFTRLSLGTGSAGYFAAARQLYAKFGFEYCQPFAAYQPDPHTVFMTKTL